MGDNGLEAENGWIFSQSSNGDSHIEYGASAVPNFFMGDPSTYAYTI